MQTPLIAHIVHRLDYGGLENGLVNLINGLPAGRFRHAVVCLTGFSEFRQRLRGQDVPVHALGKRPGKDWPAYVRLWRLLRKLEPAIVHTRNAGVMDCNVVAWAAGVPVRVHGYHGWDVDDLHGERRRRALIRRACRPFITHHVTVSGQIADWLRRTDHLPEAVLTQVYNGVDTVRFAPGPSASEPLFPECTPAPMVIGTVSRLEPVKDPCTLARAFCLLIARRPDLRPRVRLALIGDGQLRAEVEAILADGACASLAVVTGWRDDVGQLMRQLKIFVLSSLNEGISNTILEAMATGLPVIATDVGGNGELVVPGTNGALVPPADPDALAATLESLLADPAALAAAGAASRARVERSFSLGRMLDQYAALYTRLL
jgi:sugar transferase (PEP-CTERM/EpsH1 system associated)